ncbi:MAG: hypothetical protein ACRC3G_02805 [Bacteroidales bacterium]
MTLSTLFTFPLNLLIIALSMWLACYIKPSPKRTIGVFALMLCALLYISCSANTRAVAASIPFSITVFVISTYLWAVILKRIKRWRNNLYFLLNHLGLWLFVCTAYFGASDNLSLKMLATNDFDNQCVDAHKNTTHTLPFYIRTIQVGDTSLISLCDKPNVLPQITEERHIALNHYTRYKGYDIYLFNNKLPQPNVAILQVERQPWQYLSLVGIVIMFIGGSCMFYKGLIQK